MTITLSHEPESLLKRLLSAGRFADQEQAITEGLRRLAGEEVGEPVKERREAVEHWIMAVRQEILPVDLSTDRILEDNRSEV